MSAAGGRGGWYIGDGCSSALDVRGDHKIKRDNAFKSFPNGLWAGKDVAV